MFYVLLCTPNAPLACLDLILQSVIKADWLTLMN